MPSLRNTQKTRGEQAVLRVDATASPEELEAERAAEQEAIDNAEPLTAEEKEEKDSLLGQGFVDWNKRDYFAFVKGCELYGRCVPDRSER